MSKKDKINFELNSLNQGKENNIKVDFEFYETSIKRGNSDFERIILMCNVVYIENSNGTINKTRQGDPYKATIKNGVLSFNKPLKFETDEK